VGLYVIRKKIVLITGTDGTRVTLHEQLDSYIRDFADIDSFAIDNGIEGSLKADLFVISTELIYEDALKHICECCPIIVARRVINYSEIERMLTIPTNETILFVNDCKETAIESIEWLKKLGIDGYNYISFYPGCTYENKDIKYAVTPGETKLVPKFINNIIDIGPRLMDITTITEIVKVLNVFEERWEHISTKYLNKIIDMGKRLTVITTEKTENYDHIKKVIDSVNEGILAINKNGLITVFNENLKYLLGIKNHTILGKNIKQVIQDKNILEFLSMGECEEARIMQVRGTNLLLTKLSIKEDNITIIIFKNAIDKLEEEKRIIKELYNKGYYGKYYFSDIIGFSNEIVQTKNIAQKLASTDLTVLIEGESGTGKELFASAIHNASSRKDKPFVAVNCSSIAENLVESELFGYEDGAFTGAIKGGKPGIFEQANGGTIFLDEIGDISSRIQSRLLRVLQEKEVMRVGGNKIISIDVRIISATNQNLNISVNKGNFRNDLYHRLKVLYLKLPALKERKEDICHLINYFMKLKNKEHIQISNDVINKLVSYDWHGNVRELKNTLDYMLAVCNDNFVYTSDLPEESFFTKHPNDGYENDLKKKFSLDNISNYNVNIDKEIDGRGDYTFILKCLYEISLKGQSGSRAKLVALAKLSSMELTEQMIRNRLKDLETLGYIRKGTGKSGTILTDAGVRKTKLLIDK
jgi:transcriptional regulator with PAS, ATPase and Fis domain